MKVHYPKLYSMAHLLALNVLLLPKDLLIIFIHLDAQCYLSFVIKDFAFSSSVRSQKVRVPTLVLECLTILLYVPRFGCKHILPERCLCQLQVQC